jgi:hypothetical protein
MYGSRSGYGSFYHQSKKVRKTLIPKFPTVLLLLLDILSLKNDVHVPLKSNKQKNFFKISTGILLVSSRSMTKIVGSGSISQWHGSADPDPHQNVMAPEHWSQQKSFGARKITQK